MSDRRSVMTCNERDGCMCCLHARPTFAGKCTILACGIQTNNRWTACGMIGNYPRLCGIAAGTLLIIHFLGVRDNFAVVWYDASSVLWISNQLDVTAGRLAHVVPSMFTSPTASRWSCKSSAELQVRGMWHPAEPWSCVLQWPNTSLRKAITWPAMV